MSYFLYFSLIHFFRPICRGSFFVAVLLSTLCFRLCTWPYFLSCYWLPFFATAKGMRLSSPLLLLCVIPFSVLLPFICDMHRPRVCVLKSSLSSQRGYNVLQDRLKAPRKLPGSIFAPVCGLVSNMIHWMFLSRAAVCLFDLSYYSPVLVNGCGIWYSFEWCASLCSSYLFHNSLDNMSITIYVHFSWYRIYLYCYSEHMWDWFQVFIKSRRWLLILSIRFNEFSVLYLYNSTVTSLSAKLVHFLYSSVVVFPEPSCVPQCLNTLFVGVFLSLQWHICILLVTHTQGPEPGIFLSCSFRSLSLLLDLVAHQLRQNTSRIRTSDPEKYHI